MVSRLLALLLVTLTTLGRRAATAGAALLQDLRCTVDDSRTAVELLFAVNERTAPEADHLSKATFLEAH